MCQSFRLSSVSFFHSDLIAEMMNHRDHASHLVAVQLLIALHVDKVSAASVISHSNHSNDDVKHGAEKLRNLN